MMTRRLLETPPVEDQTVGDVLPAVLKRYALKPIPTLYAGIHYRSRIEARWALFFDTLGLSHEYEKEGFDLGDGIAYLPDFWMPELDGWIEIKGEEPDANECEKAHRLALASKKEVFVFFQSFTLPGDPKFPISAYYFSPHGWVDHQFMFCECPACGSIGIQFEGRSDRLPCREHYSLGMLVSPGCPKPSQFSDRGHTFDSDRIVRAYQIARTERFGT